MKKRILSVMVITALMATLFIGTTMVSAKTMTASTPKLKVGMAVQDLSNPIWAGIAQNLSALVKKNGGEMNYVSCDSNVSKQIQQIEDFIASGVNTILIQPADPAGVENVCKQARAAGIKVLSWDDNIKNCDAAYLIDNYKLGYIIGQQASQWINAKCGGTAEVAVLNYPQLPILLQRGNGIVAAIKKLSPKAKIVAQTSAINPAEGISKMETIFQANPNVKVVACIGGGAAVGANEAAKAAKKITANFGIFAADATDQEIQAIRSNEGNRMSVMVTGGPDKMAAQVYGLLSKLVAGEKLQKEVYRTLTPITAKNVDKYFKK
jgi:ribose transport system substrate-binding protein